MDTGQHLYWINTEIDKNAGTWVVGLTAGDGRSTSIYNKDCNACKTCDPKVTYPANGKCIKGWKHFNGIEWVDDNTIKIDCTKPGVPPKGGGIAGLVGDLVESAADAVGDVVESAVPDAILDTVESLNPFGGHETGNNPDCPGCADKQKSKIQIKFHTCLHGVAQVEARKAAKVTKLMEAQKSHCKLIAAMINCHDEVPLKKCFTPKEIRNMKDILIEKRLSDYATNDIGIKVQECTEVKEYLESGRADNMNKTVQVMCSVEDVNNVEDYNCN